MRVLVICDDYYHSGAIVKEGLEDFTGMFSIDFVMDMTGFEPKRISVENYDVIMLCKDNQMSPTNNSGWFTEEVEKNFLDYVEGGGGLIVIHAGTVLCRRSEALKDLVGCSFSHHPEQCEVEHKVTAEHYITKNAAPFTEKDEHYFINFEAMDAGVFLESSSEHGSQPAGYVRSVGEGRVCVLTPGHNVEVWKNQEYQKILKNAIVWCGQSED